MNETILEAMKADAKVCNARMNAKNRSIIGSIKSNKKPIRTVPCARCGADTAYRGGQLKVMCDPCRKATKVEREKRRYEEQKARWNAMDAKCPQCGTDTSIGRRGPKKCEDCKRANRKAAVERCNALRTQQAAEKRAKRGPAHCPCCGVETAWGKNNRQVQCAECRRKRRRLAGKKSKAKARAKEKTEVSVPVARVVKVAQAFIGIPVIMGLCICPLLIPARFSPGEPRDTHCAQRGDDPHRRIRYDRQKSHLPTVAALTAHMAASSLIRNGSCMRHSGPLPCFWAPSI